MKNLSGYDKLFLGLNCIPAVLLLLSCLLSYYPSEGFPFLHILNLGVPLLITVNAIFLVFWMVRKHSALLVSAITLLIAYMVFGPFYKFGLSQHATLDTDLKVMSFNSRAFNKFDWIDQPSVGDKIIEFVTRQDPDILCFQEFLQSRHKDFPQYPYSYINYYSHENTIHAVQAIFSKYPIIDKGSLDFPNTGNNAIYADVRYKQDTLRVYNVHLESLRVDANKAELSNEYSEQFLERVSQSFGKQRQQATVLRDHANDTNHKMLIMGDLNNTQFSNVYRTIKGPLTDTFKVEGKGYGGTFKFKSFPLRIDFILADPGFEIISHDNFDLELSDHEPVMATIRRLDEDTIN